MVMKKRRARWRAVYGLQFTVYTWFGVQCSEFRVEEWLNSEGAIAEARKGGKAEEKQTVFFALPRFRD